MEWDTKTTVSSLPAANTALAAGAVVCALVAAMLIQVDGSPTSATIAWIFGLVLIVPAAVTEGTLRSIRAILFPMA